MLLSKLNPFYRRISDKSTTHALSRLQKVVLNTLDFHQVVETSVNSVLTELGYLKLGYRIVVLALVNEENETLDRIAISQTDEARKALMVSPVPFKDIIIPLIDTNNLLIKSLQTRTVYSTNDWYQILRPTYKPEDATRVQKAVGIKTSMIYPVVTQGKSIGVIIFSMIKDYRDVSEEEKDVLSGFTDLVGIAVQHARLFTSVQKATQQLKVANQRLRELDKLKDDFVSIASHELRTPMTAIKSYLWMALHRPDIQLSEKMHRYLNRSYLSTERLINLVNDMLNVSRIESGRVEIKPQGFDIVALSDDVLTEVQAKAEEKHLQVEVVAEKLPPVFADPDKVHQVLLNLIGNAMKFTPDQGTITVSFFSDGKVIETSVKDSGVGISKEDLSRLFQKFGRLDNSYVAAATTGGTGLGLYISKSLIDLMGGTIKATSEGQGKGTTFTFSLPIETPQVVANAAKYTKTPIGEAKELEPVAI
ncbi:GAF domain-containing sensor histidine kinase [Patescibacteria group bacterium]|nr:GAF domain-containing sensor histidine kinase [Patescibacteria group bacterium]